MKYKKNNCPLVDCSLQAGLGLFKLVCDFCVCILLSSVVKESIELIFRNCSD